MVRGNVPSGVKVSVQGETAVRADEARLRLATAFVSVTAAAALLAGVTGVAICDFVSGQSRFVLDEELQAVEAPRMQSSSLGFPCLDSGSDVGQVFQCQRRASLNRPDDVPRQHLVAVAAETSEPTRQLLQVSLGRLGAFRLQGTTKFESPVLDDFPLTGTEKLACAGNGGAVDAQVYADNLPVGLERRQFAFHDDMQPQPVLAVGAEFGGADFPADSNFVARGNRKADGLSSSEAGKGGGLLCQFDVCRPDVIADRAVLGNGAGDLLALPLAGLGTNQRLSCFDASGTDQLRREHGIGSFSGIGITVQFDAVDSFLLPAYGTDPVE